MSKTIQTQLFKTPVGTLLLGAFENQLCLCDWHYRKMRSTIDQRVQTYFKASYEEGNAPVLDLLMVQLKEYFDGKRRGFDIPINWAGTDFQRQVWQALLEIPFGQTTTYLDLSKKLGNPLAIRAVAATNGANALSIVVPCHRVIGSNGELVGYAGGIEAKKKLLQLEGAPINAELDFGGQYRYRQHRGYYRSFKRNQSSIFALMKAASISEIKRELAHKTPKELMELCLSVGKFKKENKELLTYLLFEASNEQAYIEGLQFEMDEQFEAINTTGYYFMKKSVRKILSGVKKHIRYSKKKETEIALLLHFCKNMQEMRPSMRRNAVLLNIFDRQVAMIEKAIATLHEDLQYDYGLQLDELLDRS